MSFGLLLLLAACLAAVLLWNGLFQPNCSRCEAPRQGEQKKSTRAGGYQTPRRAPSTPGRGGSL